MLFLFHLITVEICKDDFFLFPGKRNQLTTAESNASCRVTKMRWMVEAVHGIIGKKYRLLRQQVDNKLLPKMKSLCRIASYLNNKFGKRLNSDLENREEILAQFELRTSDEDNTLATEVEKKTGIGKELSSSH